MILPALLALIPFPSRAGSWDFSFSLGRHDSQFEGAGPGGTVWESKPSYSAPYFSFQSLYRPEALPTDAGTISWGILYQNFLGEFSSERIADLNRRDEKKVETQTLSLFLQKPIAAKVQVLLGLQGLRQEYRYRNFFLNGAAIPGTQSRSLSRLGPQIGILGSWGESPSFSAQASLSALGAPHRMSFFSELEGALGIPLSQNWSLQAGGKWFLLQLERNALESD